MADRNNQRSAEREERATQASKHIGLMKGAFATDTQKSADGAIIYEEGYGRELPLGGASQDEVVADEAVETEENAVEEEAQTEAAPEETAGSTETIVTTAFAPEAIWRFGEGKVAVVDPASFTRPGGAYEDGAFGPEQILCSESNLYPILCDLKEDYYDKNRDYRRGMLFTDRAVWIPDVAFLRGGSIKKVDVIVIPEPLRARALENHRSERECDNALRTRIETFLTIAAANECQTLVVGAFGCGRLGYDAAQVIAVFQEWIATHPGALERIVFAVPRAFADAFREAFDPIVEEETVVVTEEEEASADDDDWRNIDLPEGITIR